MRLLAAAASIATIIGTVVSVVLNYRRHTQHVPESPVTRGVRLALTVVVGIAIAVFVIGLIAVMATTFAENL